MKKVIWGLVIAILVGVSGVCVAITVQKTQRPVEVAEVKEEKAEKEVEEEVEEAKEETPKEEVPENDARLMLINPNFMVSTDWISERRGQLINITERYGIYEGNQWNGVPMMDAEAAEHLNAMLSDYTAAYPGHYMVTMSCFRSVGTTCGRLCYETGASDHHTGLTCDLIDASYGSSLDTDLLDYHPEWGWLKENSWKYGFIDRFPEAWAGGSMYEPRVVNEEGSTGLYETWHYRYVGTAAADEIAHGVYNGGAYDSLEHYLLATGRVKDLLNR